MRSFFFILFLSPLFCFAQKKDSIPYFDHGIIRVSEKQWGITASLNAGKYITGTLGIAHARSEQGFEIWSISAVGVEAELIDPKRNAWGFGAEAWVNAYVSLGIALTDYTDLNYSRVCLRPMIGFGFGIIRITYGYNIRVNTNDYKIFNSNIFTLHYFFPITHKKVGQVDRKM